MQTLTREICHVVRQLKKQPGLAFTVVLTFALSIGASTLIFSVVEGVLLRPLPFRDLGRVSQILSRCLFQVSPFDVSIYCAAAFGVLLLSLAASLLPARRAAAVDPIEALWVE